MSLTLHLFTFKPSIRPQGRIHRLEDDLEIVQPGYIVCTGCDLPKPESEYRARAGRITPNRQCNHCLALKQKARLKAETPEERESRLIIERIKAKQKRLRSK